MASNCLKWQVEGRRRQPQQGRPALKLHCCPCSYQLACHAAGSCRVVEPPLAEWPERLLLTPRPACNTPTLAPLKRHAQHDQCSSQLPPGAGPGHLRHRRRRRRPAAAEHVSFCRCVTAAAAQFFDKTFAVLRFIQCYLGRRHEGAEGRRHEGADGRRQGA